MTIIPDDRWRGIVGRLRAVVRRRGVPEADIDDVVQTSLEKALRNIGTLSDQTRFEPWLKRIAANEALDRLRASQRGSAYEAISEIEPVADDMDAPDPLFAFADCVEPFLDRLPPQDAEILRLKDFDGRTHAELAEQLSLSVPGVKSRVQRARKRLAHDLMACCAVLRQRPFQDINVNGSSGWCCDGASSHNNQCSE